MSSADDFEAEISRVEKKLSELRLELTEELLVECAVPLFVLAHAQRRPLDALESRLRKSAGLSALTLEQVQHAFFLARSQVKSGEVPAPAVGWKEFRLTTYTTVPPRHELTAPNGVVMYLTTPDLLSPARFIAIYLDGMGVLPPLPEKNRIAYLQELAGMLFATRTVAEAPSEASRQGTLREDIRSILQSAPQTDEPTKMVEGALLQLEEEHFGFHARMLYASVRRNTPNVEPSDFYAALREIGAVSKMVRHNGWGPRRTWVIASDKFTEEPGSSDGTDQPGESSP